MAKEKKKTTKKKPAQNDKLAVNGSFMDLIKASVKHANNKSAKKIS